MIGGPFVSVMVRPRAREAELELIEGQSLAAKEYMVKRARVLLAQPPSAANCEEMFEIRSMVGISIWSAARFVLYAGCLRLVVGDKMETEASNWNPTVWATCLVLVFD